MKLIESELDAIYFKPAKSIVDRTISLVLMALFVVFAFSIFLSGIMRVQTVTAPQSVDLQRPAIQYPRPVNPRIQEIGDVNDEDTAYVE